MLLNYLGVFSYTFFFSFMFVKLYHISSVSGAAYLFCYWLRDQRLTNQGTEEVDSFQDELLMSYSGDAQLLQLLVGDVQQLLAPHLLPLETLHVLLETVVQTCAGQRQTQISPCWCFYPPSLRMRGPLAGVRRKRTTYPYAPWNAHLDF